MVRFFKNKKKASVFFASASLLLIGGAFALSQDISILSNLFGLGFYRTVNYEEFVSPDNWNTCETVEKILKVRNEASMKIAVRLSYDEFWKAADGETDLPLKKDGITLAEIIYQNEDDWELRDGYYYYTVDLEPNEETSSLFEGVKLSCDANLTEEESVCTQTATGTECTDPDNEYAGAHYHLRIKVETIQADKKDEWEPDESTMIYGVIKQRAQDNGLDANVDFNQNASIAAGNGNGVNIRSGTQNDPHPIYYVRGEVSDNNVIWGDYCWKILRTTETGGVKIFYNGPSTNGKCTNNNPNVSYEYDANFRIAAGDDIAKHAVLYNSYEEQDPRASDDLAMGLVGYMYDELQVLDKDTDLVGEYSMGKKYYVSHDIEYSNGKYHLINPVEVTQAFDGENDRPKDHSTLETAIASHNYYACDTMRETECDVAIYMPDSPFYTYYYYNNRDYTDIYYLELKDGALLDDVRSRMFERNVYDSTAKKIVDDWYQKNIAGKTIENDLEDTVFCNDRSLNNWPMKSPEYDYLELYDNETPPFKAGLRLNAGNNKPTYSCEQLQDRFTVSPDRGNGKLRYPIAVMSGDEMAFAGNLVYTGSGDARYFFGIEDFGISMTPMQRMGGSGGTEDMMYNGWSTGCGIIRPTVSLKYGTEFVEGGDGTLNNPFVVK